MSANGKIGTVEERVGLFWRVRYGPGLNEIVYLHPSRFYDRYPVEGDQYLLEYAESSNGMEYYAKRLT